MPAIHRRRAWARSPRAGLLALLLGCLLGGLLARPALALDARQALALSSGSTSQRLHALRQALRQPDPQLAGFLDALMNNSVMIDGQRVELRKDGQWSDLGSGKPVTPGPDAQTVVNNNYLRKQLLAARAALQLLSPEPAERLAAVRRLEADPQGLDSGLLEQALAHETDPAIRRRMQLLQAAARLRSGDATQRAAAAAQLASSDYPAVRALLLSRLQRDGKDWVEPDAAVRARIRASLQAIDGRLAWGERIGLLFSGISLGSVLLLAALGLAVTYGLMGVINMAQGEFIMLGAYTTYVVQGLFQSWLPGLREFALVAAVPCSFLVAGGVGMVAERLVLRRLYGRPLETLLATWGISLLLIQGVRSVFGPQNVQVDNPPWMSGGLHVMANLILPYNRMVILGFTVAVLLGMWLLIARTRLGLFVRAVTQNRPMAACVGVRTARVDLLAFGLGTGIAGLAGCALSQIGNVSPEMGTQYIVDCFMVVVLGGVGQLSGTVVAALGLGVANTLLEGIAGAVLAKIAVLGAIILFIQKRPQGLFALKGRSVEG
jgi:urea transport system permease protein